MTQQDLGGVSLTGFHRATAHSSRMGKRAFVETCDGQRAEYLPSVRAVDALALAEDSSLSIRRVWADRLETWPLSTDDYTQGVLRRPRRLARTMGYIEPSTRSTLNMLVFDIDRPDAVQRLFAQPIPPTWIAVNRENGHAHAGYALKRTVQLYDANGQSRALAKRALRAQEGLRVALGADPSYHGNLVKNPERGDLYDVIPADLDTAAARLYDLKDLSTPHTPTRYEDVPVRLSNPLSRNCVLFDSTRVWAYRAVRRYWGGPPQRWFDAVESRAYSQSVLLATTHEQLSGAGSLPESEVRAVAKSIGHWVWARYTPEKFAERQRALGKRGGLIGGRANTVTQNAARVLGPTAATQSRVERRQKQQRALLESKGETLNV